MDNNKVPIELTPFDALQILAFLREFFHDSNRGVQQFKAMHEVIDNYEKEIYSKISISDVDDATAELEMNILLNKLPKR